MTTNAIAISSVHRRRLFAHNPPTAPLPLPLNSIHGAFISVCGQITLHRLFSDST